MFDQFEWYTESSRYFSHVNDFVRLHILLECLDSDLLIDFRGEMSTEVSIELKFLLNEIELALELFKSTKHEVFQDVCGVWVRFQ